MKNTIKMSLVAAVTVAGLTTTASADTLQEAFAASKIKGELKSQYFTKDTESGADSSIWVNGGNISVTTGSYYGLTAGVTFQTSHVATVDGTGYAGDMDASGSVMSESYLAYKINNTSAKLGRQYISTPLVASSGSRMIKTSFEGIVLANTDIANTTLVAAYADKAAYRTDGDGDVDGFNAIADGAYTIYAKNTSVNNLTLTAQYAQIQEASANAGEDVNVLFIDAGYKLDMVKLSAEYLDSDNGQDTDSSGTLYGMKADANIKGISLTAAYTTTNDEAAVIRGLGAGAFPGYAKLTIGAGAKSYTADTDSYMVKAGYAIAGVSVGVGYANYDDNSADMRYTETELKAGYKFNKNLSANIVYASFGGDDTKDYNFRSYLSYKF